MNIPVFVPIIFNKGCQCEECLAAAANQPWWVEVLVVGLLITSWTFGLLYFRKLYYSL